METELDGNMRNRGSQYLEWLKDGDIDAAGIKLATAEETPHIPTIRKKEGEYMERLWINSTNRNTLIALKPDYLMPGPGNHLFTDLARLRRENRVLRRKIESAEGRDALLVEEKRNLAQRELVLEKREAQVRRPPRTIEEAILMR